MRYALLTTAAVAALSLSVAQGLAQGSSGGGAGGAGGSGGASGSSGTTSPGTGGTSSGGGARSTAPAAPTGGNAATTSGNTGTSGGTAGTSGNTATGGTAGTSSGNTGTSGSANTNAAPGNRGDGNRTGEATRGDGNRTGGAATGSVGSSSVNVSSEQRTQITRAFSSVNVQPLTTVNFAVRTGTVLPATVNLHPCPRQVIDLLTGIRECQFVIVKDEIVIVEPSSRKIVTVIERRG